MIAPPAAASVALGPGPVPPPVAGAPAGVLVVALGAADVAVPACVLALAPGVADAVVLAPVAEEDGAGVGEEVDPVAPLDSRVNL